MDNVIVTVGGDMAAAIRREHEAAGAAASAALEHALECGRLLADARAAISHGGWERFVRDECGIAPRTARLYLRLDANRDRLPNRQRVAGLTVREAARLLAEPKEERATFPAVAEPPLCGEIPSWYQPGHRHFGRHPSGWIFHVWPHPHGEPFVHAVTLEPLTDNVDGDVIAAGPKRGVRIDFLPAVFSMQLVNHMPPMDDPDWEITTIEQHPEKIKEEDFHNVWLCLDGAIRDGEKVFRVDWKSFEPCRRRRKSANPE
jgi:hypothetical protein